MIVRGIEAFKEFVNVPRCECCGGYIHRYVVTLWPDNKIKYEALMIQEMWDILELEFSQNWYNCDDN